MTIDFEKAFGNLSHDYIMKALSLFLIFCPNFQRRISIFYTDIKIAVQLNGYFSNFLIVERGCRQGEPISPYIFILCVEILAQRIRNGKEIKGLKVNKTEDKIKKSHFVDDTYLLLDRSDKSLTTT